MTPAARLQAAIELLDEVLAATRGDGAAADTIIARYFAARRYAGSKDRRAVRDLVYDMIRRHGTPPPSGRAAALGLAAERPGLLELFDGSRHGPAPPAAGEEAAAASPLPAWFVARFAPEVTAEDIASLAGRASLHLRVNAMHAARTTVLRAFDGAEPGALSRRAIHLPEGSRVEQHPAWRDGLVDVQDEGSQAIAEACKPRAGSTILDLCAGAGGKTLALYDAVAGDARIVACDTDRARLSRLGPRAERCWMPGIETRLLDPGREEEALADLAGKVDLVLVDAPCSGTGTWRRNPEARWRLTEERIARHADLQQRLLALAATHVAPGGHLVYAVCSLLAAEGKDRIAEFLAGRSDFSKVAPANPVGVASGDGFLLTPARHGTDGFFFARLCRPC